MSQHEVAVWLTRFENHLDCAVTGLDQKAASLFKSDLALYLTVWLDLINTQVGRDGRYSGHFGRYSPQLGRVPIEVAARTRDWLDTGADVGEGEGGCWQ